MKKRNAFTLAEILVTLGIVGVIAALTVPDLVSDYQNKTMAVKIRKFATELNEAIDLYLTDKGKSSVYTAGIEEHLSSFITSYFNIAKTCVASKHSTPNSANKDEEAIFSTGCFADEPYYSLDQEKSESFHCPNTSYVLSSSVAICPVIEIKTIGKNNFLNGGNNLTITTKSFLIYTDINGSEPPNIGGRDMFKLTIEENGKVDSETDMTDFQNTMQGAIKCKTQPFGDGCFNRLKNKNFNPNATYY